MAIAHDLQRLKPTDPAIFFDRRGFLRRAGLLTVAAGSGAGIAIVATGRGPYVANTVSGWFGDRTSQDPPVDPGADDEAIKVPFERPEVFPAQRNPDFSPDLAITPRAKAARHNNFYEFIPGRAGPVYKFTDKFEVDPWKIAVAGECETPRDFDLDDLFKFEHEERVYHFRCVETWAMNVPWSGFPLSKLIETVKPTSDAKYVRFTSANKPEQMPGMAQADWYTWPYFEALRMDEAMHELTMVATGIYGQPLLKQHGAPVRIVVPWKYGYKNPKSIVKIELLRQKPATFWNETTPSEYGFFSNVNPNSPHPRWSQAREYLLDDPSTKVPTKIFNGYEKFVGNMYPREPRTPLKKALENPI